VNSQYVASAARVEPDGIDLTGRVALITGAAGGLGAATARRLAELGATVVGVDVDDELGRRVLAGLGPPHRYVHLDVTDAAAWEALDERVLVELPSLDIVHLNAGVMLRPIGAPALDDPLLWLTADRYRRLMSVNADGVVFGLIATMGRLEAGGGGDIVVTSSLAGLGPLEIDPVYSMSKHALVGLVRSLAPVLAPRGIRLNAICPGGVDTAIVPPDLKAAGSRWSSPAFIAGVVADVLASGRSGEVWAAVADEPGGVWRHQFAPVEAPSAGGL
jgi:NAD(P)-dependent dehydrogenase (short-subunit alcohol dehydrogenase family)